MTIYSTHFANIRYCELFDVDLADAPLQLSKEVISTLNKQSFSSIVDEFKDLDPTRLRTTWIDVHHLRKTYYKIEAALSHLLIQNKAILEYNYKVLDCIELLGENQDLLFKWLDSEPNHKEELLSHIHTILTIDNDQSHLIENLDPRNRCLYLRWAVEGLSKIPAPYKEKALDLLYGVPPNQWKQVLIHLATILALCPNTDIAHEIFDSAEIGSAEHQLNIFNHTLAWHNQIQDPYFFPAIIAHISYAISNPEVLHNVCEDAKRLDGNATGEQMFDLLFFLSNFKANDRAKWIEEASLSLQNIPSTRKIDYLKKYVKEWNMANRVLSFFNSASIINKTEVFEPKTMNFSQLCDYYRNITNSDVLVYSWKTTRLMKGSSKVEAALSQVLIERKCVFEYNQTFVECLELMGDMKDALFTWLDEADLEESKAELLSYVHTLLSISPTYRDTISKLKTEDRISTLRAIIQALNSVEPQLKEELLNLLKFAPLTEWQDTIRRLKKLLDTTDSIEEKRKMLKALVCIDPVSLLKHCVVWYEMVGCKKEMIDPILKHFANRSLDYLQEVPSQTSFLLRGTNPTPATTFEVLCYLSKFAYPFRNDVISKMDPLTPPDKKLETFGRIAFVEMTLKLFPQNSESKGKDPRTPLSHIR